MRSIRLLLVAMGVWVMPFAGQACDLCGCSGGNQSLGLLPLLQRHAVGVRWQSQHFSTTPHGSGYASTEHFQSYELWGRWQVHRRWQVLASIPYAVNFRQFANGETFETAALGDATLLGQFAIIDPASQEKRRFKHAFQIGAGLKLPSGKANLRDREGQLQHMNLQAGTGSTDALFAALYALSVSKWGFALDASARLNTPGANNTQFGNRLNGNLRAFRSFKLGAFQLLPQAGAACEWRAKDFDQALLAESGGYQAYALFGAECFYKQLVLSLHAQTPVFGDLAQGYVSPKPRFSAGVSLLFGGKKTKSDTVNPFPNFISTNNTLIQQQ